MYLSINYPSGFALITNVLALVCHTVQFIYLAKFQDPENWAKNIPPKYIMTFISGAESCLMAYYFIRCQYIVRKNSIFPIFITMATAIAAIVLNVVTEDIEPWADGKIYYGAMYYTECSKLVDDNSRLRCQLIDATFVLLIVSITCWFVALFSDKPNAQKRDIEQSLSFTTSEKRKSSDSTHKGSDTSSTLVGSRKTKRSSKPPKQLPVITVVDEAASADESASEATKLLITSTKTENLKVVQKNTKSKRISASDHEPLSIHDENIKPLKALSSTEPRKTYLGRRSVTVETKPTEPIVAEEVEITEKETEKTADK